MSRKLLLPALPALFALSMAAQAQTPGASVSGYAWGDFRIGCNTCSHILIELSGMPSQEAGGDGFAQATLAYAGLPVRTAAFDDYTLAGGISYAGYAQFSGALMTPLLGAMAETDNEPGFIILQPNTPVGIDLYQASVQSRTQMLYTYLGTEATSYTFHFGLTGVVTNDQSSMFGSAAIYAGAESDFETGLIDFGSVSLQGVGVAGPPAPVAGSFSVTVEVNPGDSFWLLSQLSVLAAMTYSSADVLVDAMNTLQVTGIDGNTSLLVAAAVPEPAPWLLLTLALSTAALRRRAAS